MCEQQVKKHLFKKTYENSVGMFRIYNSSTKTPTPLSALWHISSLLQRKTQASSPSAPNWKALYLGKAGYQSFSSCPQLPVAEVKSWVWLRSGSSLLLFSLHSENGGSTLSVACLEYWDTDHLCPGSWSGGSMPGETSWGLRLHSHFHHWASGVGVSLRSLTLFKLCVD